MASKLPKFTIDYNEKKHKWDLQNDKTDKILRSFQSKTDFTSGGVLKRILGTEGGSVKIQKMDGKIQEERTYPKSADPISSKG